MITTWCLEIVLDICGFIINLLPVGDVSADLSVAGSSVATTVAGYLAVISGFVPVTMAGQLLYVTIVIVLPTVLVVFLIEWAWSHLPHVAGTGS